MNVNGIWGYDYWCLWTCTILHNTQMFGDIAYLPDVLELIKAGAELSGGSNSYPSQAITSPSVKPMRSRIGV